MHVPKTPFVDLNMKIWFDFVNTPDINMFQALIAELKEEGHEIYITCRPLANTTEMLDLHQMDYTIVGKHYGTSFIMKMLGFPIRICQLYVHLRKQKPDVAIGLSAFTLPLAAYLLGVPCIYTNDNEHAMGNIPAFLFATDHGPLTISFMASSSARSTLRTSGGWRLASL